MTSILAKRSLNITSKQILAAIAIIIIVAVVIIIPVSPGGGW